jgi:hypothetical protein
MHVDNRDRQPGMSEAANDALRGDVPPDAVGRFEHLAMIERLWQTPAAMLVMHEMPSTAIPICPRRWLRDGRHADGVGAD